MLIIKCAKCKTKLFRYLKIGQGKVLRCHKSRIQRVYNEPLLKGEEVKCPKCKSVFAKDHPARYEMIREGFTYTGTKERK